MSDDENESTAERALKELAVEVSEEDFGITDLEIEYDRPAVSGFSDSVAVAAASARLFEFEIEMEAFRTALTEAMAMTTDEDDDLESLSELSEILADHSDLDSDDLVVSDDTSPEMEGLSEGMSPSLAKEMEAVLTPMDESPRVSFESPPPSSPPLYEPESGTDEEPVYEMVDTEFDPDMADRLVKHVYRQIDERHTEDIEPETLVLGLPQYAVLEPWAQTAHGTRLEDVLPVERVVTVPGPMVHVEKRNMDMLFEYLKEQDD